LGVDVGSAWASNKWDDRFDGSFSTSYQGAGVLAGFHGGWNYQTGPIVVGVEGNLDYTNARGSAALVNTVGLNLGGSANLATEINWISTFVARGGISSGSVLYYLVGGIALNASEHTAQVTPPGFFGTFTEQTVRRAGSGYVLGAGAEFAVWQNFSAKLEYNYMDFGTASLSFSAVIGHSVSVDQQVQVVKVGLNYLFH
ncbi:MAG: outer membrane beta-barrel protein, partial [Bradyrhizobiaceae bacterium]|nr:outer membrane beta-barrel protein [Bradyrhizobiaceae bacterium]